MSTFAARDASTWEGQKAGSSELQTHTVGALKTSNGMVPYLTYSYRLDHLFQTQTYLNLTWIIPVNVEEPSSCPISARKVRRKGQPWLGKLEESMRPFEFRVVLQDVC